MFLNTSELCNKIKLCIQQKKRFDARQENLFLHYDRIRLSFRKLSVPRVLEKPTGNLKNCPTAFGSPAESRPFLVAQKKISKLIFFARSLVRLNLRFSSYRRYTKIKKTLWVLFILVCPTGFEPTTFCSASKRSIQLSYGHTIMDALFHL